MIEWMDRRQIPLFVAAIVVGAAIGLAAPWSHRLEIAIEPVLAALLFVTFLGVPFRRIGAAVRDVRFLATIGILNFVVVPVVVLGLSRFVAGETAVLIGVLLVLLTPCVDYVITFAGLAGGARDRLLAAAPLLMLAQMVLLPPFLLLFLGPGARDIIDVAPFVRAFLLLIVLPLGAAVLVQTLARRVVVVGRVEAGMTALMVPLMVATLLIVVASQIRGVGAQLGSLVAVVPIFAAFATIMIVLGIGAARVARLDVPASRALVFSGTTRNSLVVLPLALALPAAMSIAPLVVVTQTLVELVVMIVMVRVVPRLIPQRKPIG